VSGDAGGTTTTGGKTIKVPKGAITNTMKKQ
jgi:hypothetical protein